MSDRQFYLAMLAAFSPALLIIGLLAFGILQEVQRDTTALVITSCIAGECSENVPETFLGREDCERTLAGIVSTDTLSARCE